MFYKNVDDDLRNSKILLTGDIRPATFYKRWYPGCCGKVSMYNDYAAPVFVYLFTYNKPRDDNDDYSGATRGHM